MCPIPSISVICALFLVSTSYVPCFCQRLLDVNYLGSVYVTRALIGGMKRRRHGRIVFVSSQAGQLGLYGYTAYSASKYALRGLAESLQMEVGCV